MTFPTARIYYTKTESWVQSLKREASYAWDCSLKILNAHTDLISSASILAVTTCLFAEKIFKNFPEIIPRFGRLLLNFTSVISINMQVYDCRKSWHDLTRAYAQGDSEGMVQSAGKVFVKGTNILMTAIFFAASAAALGGFPQAALGIYMAMRPFALTSLVIGILGDIWDYHANETILQKLAMMECQSFASRRIASFMLHFLEIVFKKEKPIKGSFAEGDGRNLASRLIRQLDYQTIESFQEGRGVILRENIRSEVVKRFSAVKDNLLNRQSWTKANLTLLALGYLSMGICRAFPDSLVEMGARWGISVLYTDEMIRYKLFQADASKVF